MKNLSKITVLLIMLSFTGKSLAQDIFEEKNKQRLEKARTYEDSLMKVMEWKPLKAGLSISKYGDIGFKTQYHVSGLETVETYITTFCCCTTGKSFKEVIDTATFEQIAGDWGWGGYFKDKNNIYHFFGNSGGGILSIVEEADYGTFEIVNDCYGRDKNHVYDMRFGMMENINPKEFKILPKGDICIAKYGDVYYRRDHPLSEEDMKDPETQKAIKKLDKYFKS